MSIIHVLLSKKIFALCSYVEYFFTNQKRLKKYAYDNSLMFIFKLHLKGKHPHRNLPIYLFIRLFIHLFSY